MNLPHLLQLLLFCFCTTGMAKKYAKDKDATLLSNVRSLTLQSGKQTSARRVKPIPQLTCVGGNGCKHYAVDVMRCKNTGSEYDPEDIQWTCQASLPAEFRLGSTEVVCEGYDSSDDPYVLKGSCGVEYRLVLTDVGEERYLGRRGGSGARIFRSDGFDEWEGTGKRLLNSAWTFLFWAIFIVILVVIVRRILNPDGRFNAGNGGGWGGWGGGGGGGGFNDDPPPPYTPRAPPRPKSQSTRYGSSSNQGWRPGFWSGAAMGGAAGYMAGNRNQNRTRQPPLFGGAGPSGYGGSSWGGGGGGGSSSFGAGPSSSRHESTGFGGTRRR